VGGNHKEHDERPKDPFEDIGFLDIPEQLAEARRKKQGIESEAAADEADRAFEQLTGKRKVESTGARKYPAVIDIFLYPFSLPAMGFMAVIFGVPLVMYIIREAIMVATLSFPGFAVFLFAHFFINIIVELVLAFYLLWYYCECIRDSGEGGVRAPETIAAAPGLGEILWKGLKLLLCVAICLGPFFYYSYGLFSEAMSRVSLWGQVPTLGSVIMSEGSVVSLLLLGTGIFFLPMVVLSVVMFDSLWGFNPLVVIGSIASTFFQYCGLLLVYVCMWAVLFTMMYLLRKYLYMPIALNGFIGRCLGIYICLVGSHLLGRFYWRYEKRLQWDV